VGRSHPKTILIRLGPVTFHKEWLLRPIIRVSMCEEGREYPTLWPYRVSGRTSNLTTLTKPGSPEEI